MVGQQQALLVKLLNGGEEVGQQLGVIHIGHAVTDFVVDLRQCRQTHAILAVAQIQQDQVGFTLVGAQLRRQCLARIQHRRKAGDDQRHRCSHALLLAVVMPNGTHGHGVLAHRNGDAQLRTQLHTHRLDGVIQFFVFARVAGSAHPVGGQFDVGQLTDTSRGQVGDGLTDRHAA